jgi:hypothetical protein
MAQVIAAPSGFGERLQSVIENGLRSRNIDATVEIEHVPDVDMFRVLVTTPKFRNLWGSERQGLIWRIIEDAFSREEQYRISGVFALTPKEMEGEE